MHGDLRLYILCTHGLHAYACDAPVIPALTPQTRQIFCMGLHGCRVCHPLRGHLLVALQLPARAASKGTGGSSASQAPRAAQQCKSYVPYLVIAEGFARDGIDISLLLCVYVYMAGAQVALWDSAGSGRHVACSQAAGCLLGSL